MRHRRRVEQEQNRESNDLRGVHLFYKEKFYMYLNIRFNAGILEHYP